jgi:hypothetical protein
MARVKRDCPRHFLQEEAPDEIGRLLAEFFARPAQPGALAT